MPASRAATTINLLRAAGLLREDLKVRREGKYVLIPVKDSEGLKDLMIELGGDVVLRTDYFESKPRLGLSYRDLLRGRIPRELIKLLPRSFRVVGDLALIDLPEELMPYARDVAEAIMEVSKNVKGVFALRGVEGDFRVEKLVHLGGVKRTETIHTEYGIKFYVDLSKVYFNPTLSTEHRLVAEEVGDGELILDLFSGVGPFAIHIAALRESLVVAVDVNPHAISCLLKSLELNSRKLRGEVIAVRSKAEEIIGLFSDSLFDRVIMNLPHKATDYVPSVLPKVKVGGKLYIYVIATSEKEARSRVEVLEGVGKALNIEGVRKVLDYAPRKYIFRVVTSRKA